MSALDKIISKSRGRVNILISSREEDDIRSRMNQEPGVNITSEQNGKDLGRFIEVKVKEFIQEWSRRTGRNSQELKTLEDDTVTALEKGAQGMFLWVTLQLEAIQNTDRIKFDEDVRAALSHLPQSLTESYDAIHDRIMEMEEASKRVATAALQWLLCTRRTLKIQEFVAAVSRSTKGTIHLSPSMISSCCCNLVVLDSKLDAFRFAHPSVRRCLESRLEYDAVGINSAVVTRCLSTYTRGDFSTDPLIEYATNYWPAHCEAARTSDRATNLNPLLLQFFTEEEHFENWHDNLKVNLQKQLVFWSLDYPPKIHSVLSSPPSPLFAICSFGYLDVLEYLLSNLLLPDLEIVNDHKTCGLYLAARSGHTNMVKYLVRHNCNINSPGERFGTAIKGAAFAGHADIVQFLMDEGASMSCSSGEFGDPMQAALAGGHQGVIRTLFEGGFTFLTQAAFDHALQLASFNGHVDAVEQLLDGMAGDFSPAESHVPLQVALYGRKEKAAKRLIEACQDVNEARGYFGNALQAAIAGGKLSLVQLVLEKGGNTNVRGRFGYPVRAAATRGQDDIVKLLLDHGASPNAQDDELGDPLQAAASKGHLSTMSILIDHKANVESSGGPFNSPLEAALRTGNTQAATLLRENLTSSTSRPMIVHKAGRTARDPSTFSRSSLSSAYWK
ncbi:ankyrin repeat-containing domain protein [Phyllosticta capitalensis]